QATVRGVDRYPGWRGRVVIQSRFIWRRQPLVRRAAGIVCLLADHQIVGYGRNGLLEGRRETENPIVSGIQHIEISVLVHRQRRWESESTLQTRAVRPPLLCSEEIALADYQIRKS